MPYKHFFLLLSLGYVSRILTQPYKAYACGVEEYQKLAKSLEVQVAQPDAYRTPASRAEIKAHVEFLARFAVQEVSWWGWLWGSRNKAQGVFCKELNAQVNVPQLIDAPTQKEISVRLFKQALENCNEAGVRFLKQEYNPDVNAATMHARTALHMIGEQQFHETPARMLQLLLEMGLDKKHINTWNAVGQNPVHKAAACLVTNYRKFKDPEKALKQHLGKKTLEAEDDLKRWISVRREGMQNQGDLMMEYIKLGAQDVPNKEGNKPTDILKECAGEDGPCREVYQAFLKVAAKHGSPVAADNKK